MRNLTDVLCASVLCLLPCFAEAQVLNWQLAVPKSIQINRAEEVWHAGRVEDAVDFADGRVLVGTNGGGIWWADKSGRAAALSDDWDDPDITAVERGPDSQFHVYVATTVRLRENFSSALNGWQVLNTPPNCTIRDIAVMRGPRRIFLACSNGLFWSDIPAPGAPRVYSWWPAIGASATSDIRSIAVKPTQYAWGLDENTDARGLVSNPGLALVARSPIHRDLFWVASDGTLKTAWHVRGGSWRGNTRDITAAGAASPVSSVAAVARGETHLDVFFIGPAGELRSTWWNAANGDWLRHMYTVFGAGTAAIGSSVAAIATPESIDVFWITADGRIMHAHWAGSWSSPQRVAATGEVGPFTQMAVAAPTPELLDVFWIGPDGSLRTNHCSSSRLDLWRGTQIIASGTSLRSGLSAVSRDMGKLDVAWVAADGRLMTSSWNTRSNWSSRPLTGPGVANGSGRLSLTTRNPLQLDLFWQGADGMVHTNYWNQTTSGSFAAQTFLVGDRAVRNLTAASAFDEELTTCSVLTDGRVTCRQWMHNNGVVLAGLLGANTTPLVWGTFTGGNLSLTAGRIASGDGSYSSTAVAVSKYGRAAYAVVANPADNTVKYVLRSMDRGSSWTLASIGVSNQTDGEGRPCTLQTCAGGQGDGWNNTIAVSPTDDTRVYIGWVGLYESKNGAASWRQVVSPHIHADIAGVGFGDFDRNGITAYFSTDGGLSATFNGGASYFSGYNERLATLQCYTTDGIRQIDGTLSASYQVNGLIGAGLQDNGNVWAIHGTAWTRIDGGDGGYFTFLREPQVVQRLTLNDTPFSRFQWDGHALVNQGVIPVDRVKPGVFDPPRRLKGGFVIVNAPVAWDIFGAKIYGFVWTGTDIYSFWNPTGVKGWRFEFEATASLRPGETFNAGGSANGQVSFFGTSHGRIFSYDRRTNRVTETPVDLSSIPAAGSYGINRMTILSDTLGFALINCWQRGGCSADAGYVLKFDGVAWRPLNAALTTGGRLPIQRYYSIEADWTVLPQTLLLTSDDKVYRSTNLGASWSNESTGLPRRAHLADLRFVVFPDGTKRFYLGTFGRSVWYADVR